MGTAPVITLNSSHKMPLIGFGTAVFPFAEADAVKQATGAILCGIKNGYRHFDTASVYQTEETLGQAIKQALNLGLIQSRDELFITSKLWCCDSHPELVLPALKQTLQKLQLEYLDLYLIHWPVSSKPGNYEYATPKEEVLPMDFKSVWAGMEECQRLGLSKSIGVSNFSCKKLEEILTTAKITPSVNEVEMNLVWQQNKLGKFCKEKGIIVTAYSPLGAKGTSWGSNKVMDNEALKEIAKTRGKTPAQVCLRWLYEQGVGVAVKSFNEGRMKENLDIFDWELSEEEHELISQIPQSKANTGENFVWAKGPFKSLEEFWDGEI